MAIEVILLEQTPIYSGAQLIYVADMNMENIYYSL